MWIITDYFTINLDHIKQITQDDKRVVFLGGDEGNTGGVWDFQTTEEAENAYRQLLQKIDAVAKP